MKYINFKDIGIVIFGDHITHKTMKDLISREVISAGSFSASPESAQCFGKSVSLNIQSRPEDTDWIQHFIGEEGVIYADKN